MKVSSTALSASAWKMPLPSQWEQTIQPLAQASQIRTIQVHHLINGALDLLSDPNHWTHSYLAVDAAGEPVPPDSRHAVRWCAMGAICRVGSLQGISVTQVTAAIMNLDSYAQTHYSAITLGEVNDRLGYERVMELLRRYLSRDNPAPKEPNVEHVMELLRRALDNPEPGETSVEPLCDSVPV